MLELARDFVAAGLLDRAENVLISLLNDDELADDARKMLLQIYEQLNEWQKAIDIASSEQSRPRGLLFITSSLALLIALECDC